MNRKNPGAHDTPTALDKPQPKLVFVDWLRGMAILLVIVVHHSVNFPGSQVSALAEMGQLGVQLFFVASALTLCGSAEARQGERRATAKFYTRRLFRIAPLYWLGIGLYTTIAVTAAAFGKVGADTWYTAPNILANVLLVHGFVPAAQNHIVPGGWSIGTEVAFYAVFPLLLRFYLCGCERWPRGFVFGMPAAGIALNLALQIGVARMTGTALANNSFLYFSLPNQLPVFLIGMSGFFLLKEPFAQARLIPAVMLAGSLACCAWLLRTEGTAGMALMPSIAGIGFLGLVPLAMRYRHARGGIERIGEVSYSMYVFHFLFAWWGTHFIIQRPQLAHLPPYLLYTATLLGTIAASYAVGRISKRVIEDPAIRLGRETIQSLDRRYRAEGEAA
ncbi:MAG: hypothetical protein RIS94_777 [Pseudomonadota bacterium]